MNLKVLLVQPKFPTPNKSINHKDFLPIPLLKIASYHRSHGDTPHLVHGNVDVKFEPDLIYITSLFTYWQKEFWDTVKFYRTTFPETPINVGGIYVTFFYDKPAFKEKCAEFNVTPFEGVVEEFEKFAPD